MTSGSLRLATVITGMTYGGAQRILVDYLTRLPAGVQCEVFCLYPGPLSKQLVDAGIPVTEWDLRGVASLKALPRLIREFRRFRPQIVHTHLGKADFVGRPAARLAGVPIVITTSHNREDWKLQPVLNALDNWSLRLADRIITVSGGVKEFLIERGAPADRLRVCHARSELRDRFAEKDISPARRDHLKSALQIPNDSIVSIMVGRMYPQKAHETALDAMAKLRPTAPHVLLLAGDGPLRGELEEQGKKLGISDQLRFLGNRDDVPDLLRFADIFVMPSRWEGAGIALMEAHAAALPAVITDIPAMREVAEDCQGSLASPVDDSVGLARNWQTLLGDAQLRRKLGDFARDRALANWDIRHLVQTHLDIYREILRERGLADVLP